MAKRNYLTALRKAHQRQADERRARRTTGLALLKAHIREMAKRPDDWKVRRLLYLAREYRIAQLRLTEGFPCPNDSFAALVDAYDEMRMLVEEG